MTRIGRCGPALALLLACVPCPRSLSAQRPATAVKRSTINDLLKREVAAPLSVVGRTAARALADTTSVLHVASHEYVAAVIADKAIVDTTNGKARFRLPIRYVQPDASGEHAALYLVPAVEVEGGGLEYVPDRGLFSGSVLIGLEDSITPTASKTLDPPVYLQLTTDNGSVDQPELRLQTTNIPFRRVVLESRAPGDSITVRVRPQFSDERITFSVPVRRPALHLEVAPRAIQGFGLEVATVTVTLPPGSGAAPRTVVLGSHRVAPEPPSLTVAGAASAEAVLRSRGVGTDTITASSPPFASIPQEIVYQWPIAFLVAAVFGAGLGTVASHTAARRQQVTGSLARRAGDALSGFLVGVLTAVAYAVGINLTGLQITAHYGEALVAVLAALGAIYGLPGLSKAVPALQRLSGSQQSNDG